jgi:hypothetical protein
MLTRTFEARVENGQLHAEEPLTALEGQRVRITLVPLPPSAPTFPEDEQHGVMEAPDEMDVEKDVYVKIPLPGEDVEGAVIVKGGPLQPCLIFPEELPDD